MNAKLVVVGKRNAGMEIPISTPTFLIGRGNDCQFRVVSNQISRRHCVVSVDGVSAAVEDCGSANGTLVNGAEIHGRRELHSGDRIGLGTLVLSIRLTTGAEGEKKPTHNAEDASERAVATGASGAAVNEAVILHWLEEGEDMDVEDFEKYWRDATSRGEQPSPNQNSKTDKMASVAQETEDGVGLYGDGMGGGLFGEDVLGFDGHPRSATKTWLQRSKTWLLRLWSPLRALAAGLHRFLKSLGRVDLLLFGVIVIMLFVVVLICFPGAWTWCRAILNVRKWPFWVWTCIFTVILGYLAWLRSRYE